MVDLLVEEGFRVRGIDNLSGGRTANLNQHSSCQDFEFEEKDILTLAEDDGLFKEAAYVFHFAGLGDIVPSIDRPTQYLETNVQGTVRVLEAARRAEGLRKLVYAASSSCYGIPDEVPTTEQAEIRPEYPYALSKYQGEQAVRHWWNVYGMPANSIRIFNAYGPRSRTSGAYGAVFGVFLAQKLAGKPFTVVGDGTQTRDFVYATDVARAFLMAARTETHTGEVFNLGNGTPQSVNRLVELLEGPVVYVEKRPGEPDTTWADTAKIRTLLGWEPLVSFEDGVAEMLRNIDYWAKAPVWDPEMIRKATKGWFDALSKRDTVNG